MGRNRVAFRNSVVWLPRLAGDPVAMNGPDGCGRIRTVPMPAWVKVAWAALWVQIGTGAP